MARDKEPKGTTWPWVICAFLFVVLIVEVIAVVWFSTVKESQLERIRAAETAALEFQKKEYAAFKQDASKLIELTGIGAYKYDNLVGRVTRRNIEENPPNFEPGDELSEAWQAYVAAQRKLLRSAPEVSVEQLSAQIIMFEDWGNLVRGQRAWRTTAYNYDAEMVLDPMGGKSVDDFATPAGEASADAGGEDASVGTSGGTIADQVSIEALLAAIDRSQTEPGDAALAKAVQDYAKRMEDFAGDLDDDIKGAGLGKDPKLADIMLANHALIQKLVRATYEQANAVHQVGGGYNQANEIKAKIDNEYSTLIATLKEVNTNNVTLNDDLLTTSNDIGVSLKDLASGNIVPSDSGSDPLTYLVQVASDDIGNIASELANERQQATRSAAAFRELISDVKPLGEKYALTQSFKVDGEVSYVSQNDNQVYINLGKSDNIKSGMRFEVWRISGKDPDRMRGMVEVLYPLNQSYSLCVVLDTNEEFGSIEEGDALIHIFWDEGEYLPVALHGVAWGGKDTRYEKYELAMRLRKMGVQVANRATAETKVVILGKQVAQDEHFRVARRNIDFDSFNESRIRLYVDPR